MLNTMIHFYLLVVDAALSIVTGHPEEVSTVLHTSSAPWPELLPPLRAGSGFRFVICFYASSAPLQTRGAYGVTRNARKACEF